MWYKRNIQSKKIQCKRVLGLIKYTHRLVDHNKVTQLEFFLEIALSKSKGVLILRTIPRHNQKTDTAAQLYCTLSMYVIPKTISRQNQKTSTMPQLYCTLSTWICNIKTYFRSETKKLTQQHNWKKSSSSPCAASVTCIRHLQ